MALPATHPTWRSTTAPTSPPRTALCESPPTPGLPPPGAGKGLREHSSSALQAGREGGEEGAQGEG